MIEEQRAVAHPSTDPRAWVDEHGDYLFGYAMFRLRDAAAAEDLVQETLLAALQGRQGFAGRGSERTWLTGILKHKLADYFRRLGRETPVSQLEEEASAHGEFFRPAGEWEGHWEAECAPLEWRSTPEELLRESEFFRVLDECLSPLPARVSGAFVLREVDGLASEEICRMFGVTSNNLWVMLHRARLHLRHCLELNWFKPRAA
ncbi:MAG TPA: sigma-70 family RNA polymerase sigma factor [Pyrinomonadaceae bacterium]|jgi:RNA polymerase sigma-70 factor (ECF subfamily)|nr:sigma-70 family RNA polymerase sigma factor [Pyrinomonadaceae bacterium]